MSIPVGILQQANNDSVTPMSYVGATSYNLSDGTSGALPSGMQEDDVVFCFAGQDAGNPVTNLLPTGYTEIDSSYTNDPSYIISYKVMGATPDTTATWFNATGGALIFVAIRGVDTSTIQDTTETNSSGSTGMPNCPSITPSNNYCLIFASGFLDDEAVESSVTAPSGFTLADSKEASNTGQFTGMVAYKIQTTKAAVNPAAFGGTGDDDWRAVTQAIRNATI